MVVSMPVSALANYNDALSHVDAGSKVILTENGRAKYTIVDIKTWQYTTAMLRFLSDMQAVNAESPQGER